MCVCERERERVMFCLFVRLFSGKTKKAQMTGWLDYCKEFS